jgi:MraZ protein
MFLGQYYHNIDEKGRLTVPARFRDLITAEGAFVMRGFDLNLIVLTSSTFNSVSKRINQTNMTDPTSRLLRRLIFSSASQVEFDRAGRILIPQFLRQAIDLESDAVIVGAGDFFEIWSKAAWSNQVEMLQDAGANAQRFMALELSSG